MAILQTQRAAWNFQGFQAFSVSLWVNLDAVSAAQTIIGWPGSLTTNGGWSITAAITTGNYELNIGTTAGTDTHDSGIAAVTGSWDHVLAVVDATNLTLVVNGTSGSTARSANQMEMVTDDTVRPQISDASAPILTGGLVKKAGVWRRALNSAEQASLLVGATSDSRPSLGDAQSFHMLEEDSGEVRLDRTANNFDLYESGGTVGRA